MYTRLTVMALLLTGTTYLGSAASGQTPKPQALLTCNFEDGEQGWAPFGIPDSGHVQVALTRAPADVHTGAGALKITYTVARGEMNATLHPIDDGSLAKAKCIRFWVKADHATTVGVLLQEKDAGRYTAVFAVPKGAWQQVELAPGDFTLMTGNDDPKDPDGKLDMDQVNGLGLADFAQMLAQIGDADVVKMLGLEMGPRALLVDDFAITDQTVTSGSSLTADEYQVDTLAHPQAGWIGIGPLTAKVTQPGKPFEHKTLQLDYTIRPGGVAGLMHPLPVGKLSTGRSVKFQIASANATKLIVQFESVNGNKHRAVIDVKGGSWMLPIDLPMSAFTVAEDSKDKTAALDMAQVNQLMLGDITGFLGGPESENHLWITGLRITLGK